MHYQIISKKIILFIMMCITNFTAYAIKSQLKKYFIHLYIETF